MLRATQRTWPPPDAAAPLGQVNFTPLFSAVTRRVVDRRKLVFRKLGVERQPITWVMRPAWLVFESDGRLTEAVLHGLP